MKSFRLLAFLFSLPLCLISLSLEAETEDAQFWNQYVATGKIGDKSLAFFEFQPRVGGDFEQLSLFIARGAIGYQFAEHWSLWQGYAWVPVYTERNGRDDEHRSFQQLLGTHPSGDKQFINRTRLEQRFLEGLGQTSYRLRHLIRLNYQPESFGRYFLGSYNEVFLNLNSVDSASSKSGFDQNRLYLGLGYNFSDLLNTEFGYIYNYIRNAERDLTNHITYLGLRYNW